MKVTRIIADVHVASIAATREFYTDFLGLRVEEFDLGWVARFTAPEPNDYAKWPMIQLMTGDLHGPVNPGVSILTPDVTAAYAEAQSRGYEIVYPLTVEPWGVHRFFVRAPDGNVFNIVKHDS